MPAFFPRCCHAVFAVVLLAVAGHAADAAPPAPDYAQDAAWAALPGHPGLAGDVPSGVAKTVPGDVAVFFIHPTTDYSLVIGNAPFDAGGAMRKRLDAVLEFQTSVFNACCEVYAPRYRQASLRAITANTPEAYAADDIAYGDIARAFDVFLARIGDAPFIIASHSQGSIHAVRLLEEKIIGTPLQKRLIAAYPIGTALPRAVEQLGLPICRSPDETGCVVTGNSVATGHDDLRRRNKAVIWWDHHYQPIAGRPLTCVNPLNWRLDGTAPAADNLGGIYSDGPGKPMPAPVPGVTGAACENGLLGVDVIPSQKDHYTDILTRIGIYHVFDYGLFYMNIRANLAARIAAWHRLRHN